MLKPIKNLSLLKSPESSTPLDIDLDFSYQDILDINRLFEVSCRSDDYSVVNYTDHQFSLHYDYSDSLMAVTDPSRFQINSDLNAIIYQNRANIKDYYNLNSDAPLYQDMLVELDDEYILSDRSLAISKNVKLIDGQIVTLYEPELLAIIQHLDANIALPTDCYILPDNNDLYNAIITLNANDFINHVANRQNFEEAIALLTKYINLPTAQKNIFKLLVQHKFGSFHNSDGFNISDHLNAKINSVPTNDINRIDLSIWNDALIGIQNKTIPLLTNNQLSDYLKAHPVDPSGTYAYVTYPEIYQQPNGKTPKLGIYRIIGTNEYNASAKLTADGTFIFQTNVRHDTPVTYQADFEQSTYLMANVIIDGESMPLDKALNDHLNDAVHESHNEPESGNLTDDERVAQVFSSITNVMALDTENKTSYDVNIKSLTCVENLKHVLGILKYVGYDQAIITYHNNDDTSTFTITL